MRLKTIFASFAIVVFALSILLIISSMPSTMAYTTTNITAPATNYSTSTTLTINVSGGINASGVSGLTENATINVTILNKSSSAGTYGAYQGIGYLINASGDITDHFWNKTITLTEGRHWIRLNFTNSTGLANLTSGTLSDERLIEIDIDYNIMTIGQNVINLSTDTGNVNISGILSADGGARFRGNVLIDSIPLNTSVTGDINTSGVVKSKILRLGNSTQTADDCTGAKAGELLFNGTGTNNSGQVTSPGLIFCNGITWKVFRLNQTV